MKNNTIAIALASLLVGGVAVAAFQNNRDSGVRVDGSPGNALATTFDAEGDVLPDDGLKAGRLEYARVVDVDPVTEKKDLYATVIGSEPVRETSTTSSPREVCEDVVVQERLPERDGNVGGTVAGALIGGLVGNQVGGGNGKKAATAAGAVAGGFVGNRVDRNHVGGRVASRTDRRCRTVSDTSQSTRVVAYNVTYRNPDGTTGTMRTGSKPGNQIALGTSDEVVGYDVTYQYGEQRQTIRMEQEPGERLPVIDGEVVTQTAAVDAGATRG